MTRQNSAAQNHGIRLSKWQGSHEFLHAQPRQTIGNTHLVFKARQSGIIK